MKTSVVADEGKWLSSFTPNSLRVQKAQKLNATEWQQQIRMRSTLNIKGNKSRFCVCVCAAVAMSAFEIAGDKITSQ
jgi:hypothetical protein